MPTRTQAIPAVEGNASTVSWFSDALPPQSGSAAASAEVMVSIRFSIASAGRLYAVTTVFRPILFFCR